ncbi:MAG: MBL fold metallo-hydrolase [Planctomycetes bacterium]|nr:MBL fold metallo-hydrolase [Planctomycetota bacterium]
MKLKQFILGPFVNNLFLLIDQNTNNAVLIDASFEIEKVINYVNQNKINLQKVILTHGHIDHIYGVKKIKSEFNPEIILHKNDLWLYENISMQGQMFGFNSETAPNPDLLIDKDINIEFSGNKLEIFETPGHTPGSISIKTKLDNKDIVFTGDTLFYGSIGRTDLWGGSYETIELSIKKRLYNLPENTIVYTGHGEETSIKSEKSSNAFVRT